MPHKFARQYSRSVTRFRFHIYPLVQASHATLKHVNSGLNPAISARHICFAYQKGTPVLTDVSFDLAYGESLAIVGRSGLGKTTLLRLVDGSLVPTNGDIHVCDHPLRNLSTRKRLELRRKHIGRVFQTPRLVPEFSVMENVMLPALLSKTHRNAARERATALLDRVEVDPKTQVLALSGGQACRVAVARALICDPQVVIADEPTANLDPVLAQTVFSLLLDICRGKRALLMVSHDQNVANQCVHVARLKPAASSGAILEAER